MTDHPRLEWRDGVPVATRYGDPYYALPQAAGDGLAEARHVYLAGNDLPGRLRAGFAVAELGFGTGLNALALCAATRVSVTMTSFEAHPMARDDIARALAPFAGLATEALLDQWPGPEIALPGVALRIVEGDARATVPDWAGRADAWFLDGFAPARNPEMWEAGLLSAVAARTAPGGTFATFTAAGAVRRDLDAAGFDVARVAGFGAKRHMTRGVLR